MPNYLEYQRSISDEIISIKDRVRFFIDDRHWGEDGRYKEIILSNILQQHLPRNISVGTGFIVNNDKITKQIDIIIYANDYPILFKQDNFVIVPAECVLGMIEVKSRVDMSSIKSIIKKCTDNGEIVERKIFNGIFAFENSITQSNIGISGNEVSFRKNLIESGGIVNHICLGTDIFIKFWEEGHIYNNQKCYAMYSIEKLAFGYFISNLVECSYLIKKMQNYQIQ